MPHDVIVDADGKVWYSDFGQQFVGVMDPRTGQVKDIPIPVLKPEQPRDGTGWRLDLLSYRVPRAGAPWY